MKSNDHTLNVTMIGGGSSPSTAIPNFFRRVLSFSSAKLLIHRGGCQLIVTMNIAYNRFSICNKSEIIAK